MLRKTKKKKKTKQKRREKKKKKRNKGKPVKSLGELHRKTAYLSVTELRFS